MRNDRAAYGEEIDASILYDALSRFESNPKLAGVYKRIADSERLHAERIAARLRAAGLALPAGPSTRARILTALARRFGPAFVLPSLAAREAAHADRYARADEPGDATLAGDSRAHARLVRALAVTPGGVEGAAVMRMEGRHRGAGGNALRAAVLGASDGLLSNLSLVMGVAGADLPGNGILISGVAGLLAGAFSMALGEWLSVQSSRELYERQLNIESAEIAAAPEEEADELSLIYEAKGLDRATARALAARVAADPKTALDTLAREELAIDPLEMGGSAWEAAITSFLLFAVGAVVPVLPFLWMSGASAIAASLALGAAGLFGIGAATTLYTARGVLRAGLRQVLFGLVSSAVTFGLGRWIGVGLSG
jgi:VIT1/CCC1 family predicted Fe2+/Mn2+ transporter